jgi:NADPH-dependent 2,4-dienoyl-CoA reductase/sulfur reductase-like enzyme
MWMILLALLASQQPNRVAQQVMELRGEVNRIDRAGRTITIRSAGVVQEPIYAGPDLAIFDQLQSGDTVIVRFYDAYVAEVTPGARMAPPQNTTEEARKALDRDDARVMQQSKIVVTVDAIDTAGNMVTYHGFDNRRVLRQVQRAELLQGIKVGDVVTLTFTRAQAVTIEKAP